MNISLLSQWWEDIVLNIMRRLKEILLMVPLYFKIKIFTLLYNFVGLCRTLRGDRNEFDEVCINGLFLLNETSIICSK